MVRISTPLGITSPEGLTLFSTTEPLLSNSPILVFHGPSSTANVTHSSWRIQAHIFGPAGLQSYPRITTSPNSALYAAVNHLPPDQQGDEVRRGLAISLLKYFWEMPEVMKKTLVHSASPRSGGQRGQVLDLFGEAHAGDLASRMVKVDNSAEVLKDMQSALDVWSLSNIDLDLVLPSDLSLEGVGRTEERPKDVMDDDDDSSSRYGIYAPLVRLFGLPSFLPTSKLQRAPSRPLSHNRKQSLSKEQEASVKREMHELVETEERYVTKLDELVHRVAQDFRLKARQRMFGSLGPDERALKDLFPESLDEILNINKKFLDAMRVVLGQAAGNNDQSNVCSTESILEFSKALLCWFPQFANCYGTYIRASGGFPQLLSRFLKDPGSRFSQHVRETGEQRLRAMLIEPVQRLPRYSLFIDNITSVLPVKHPAMQPLLQARDMIANICALQSSGSEESNTTDRLRNLVASWPSNLRPQGRLINAADYVEVAPPYRLDRVNKEQNTSVFLLFSDYMISVKKSPGSSLTARGVIAEVDRPSRDTLAASVVGAATGQRAAPPLVFDECYQLKNLSLSESTGASLVYMMSKIYAKDAHEDGQGAGCFNLNRASLRAFYLLGSYEGRVSRWTEEVAKARIEGRFTEQERESPKWELRSVTIPEESLTLFTAIFQEPITGVAVTPRNRESIRIAVSNQGSEGAAGLNEAANRAMFVVELNGDMYRLETRFGNSQAVVDEVGPGDFARALAEKLGALLRQQIQPRDSASAANFLTQNMTLLRSLNIQFEGDQTRSRNFRPPSPVKFLSNFLSAGTARDLMGVQKQPFPKLGELTPILSPVRKTSGSGSRKRNADPDPSRIATVVSNRTSNGSNLSFEQLEECLVAYILALQERQGDIVGNVLIGRRGADELLINTVYNTLLEDPTKLQVLAEAPVQVLFMAFERFLKMAWKSHMGSVVSSDMWYSLQDRAGTLLPSAFENHFKVMAGDMAPQNRRAFKAIIKLLADLLEASGNDGDRGALTAAFAELLVNDGDPHVYISLLDRLVEDFDSFFEERKVAVPGADSTPRDGSVNSSTRMRAANTGSISSNTSSLRKRFGFPTLSRENSKLETESKVGSVWRTLSKTARGAVTGGEGTPGSASKMSLKRSKSTEMNSLMLPPLRPASRDRPPLLGVFTTLEESSPRPQSSRGPPPRTPNSQLESPVRTPAGGSTRKKRRSSLSDLKTLQDSPGVTSFSLLPIRTPEGLSQASINSSPRTPSPVKMPIPSQPTPRSMAATENHGKVNSSLPMARGTLMERAMNIQSEEAPRGLNSSSVKKGGHRSPSGIPVLKGSPGSRPGSNMSATPTRKSSNAPQKLRIPSPQKIRERVANEQKAIGTVDKGLQAELAKIGEEMSLLNRHHSNARTHLATSSSSSSSTITMRALNDRISKLESQQTTSIKDLQTRVHTLQKQLDTSVGVLERKSSSVEELYRDTTAENEMLYERFNEELGKLCRVVGGGDGHARKEVDDGNVFLLAKVKDLQTELGRVKKENARLKRENVGLKAIVAGAGAGAGAGGVPMKKDMN